MAWVTAGTVRGMDIGHTERMPEFTGPCPRQQELIEEAQNHLLRLAEMARMQAKALESGNENFVMELDKQVENELGAKERSLGRLRQHREEHGC